MRGAICQAYNPKPLILHVLIYKNLKLLPKKKF